MQTTGKPQQLNGGKTGWSPRQQWKFTNEHKQTKPKQRING